ncbi:phosphoribosyl transferase [Gordonia phage Neville]|uniref:Phosphoribosyltransferase n=1 Tax=Gordonia phage Neville TaxID=2301693 RepID=A0A385E0H6_9CAUD|nr:phosphoribosyl transferase [Gordonia phage Neville]AXQ64417.1 phosphoribosyltransferase [Gordonia phage Neville]
MIRQAPPFEPLPTPRAEDGKRIYLYDKPHYVDEGTQPTFVSESAKFCLEGVEFDTVVGIGVSGAVALPPAAMATGTRMLVLRKPGVSAHSTAHTGSLGRSWVFVDDFIGGGTTFKGVREQVDLLAAECGFTSRFAGAFLYGYWPSIAQIHNGAADHRAPTFLDAEAFYDRYPMLAPMPDDKPLWSDAC